MQVGDRIVVAKKIKLVNGKVYRAGTKGEIVYMPIHMPIHLPPNPTAVHVVFEGSKDPCAVELRSIRSENEPPTSLLEKIWRLFSRSKFG